MEPVALLEEVLTKTDAVVAGVRPEQVEDPTPCPEALPFSDEEAVEVLALAEVTLPAPYRGAGMPFGKIVTVPVGATPIDRLVGFMGRKP